MASCLAALTAAVFKNNLMCLDLIAKYVYFRHKSIKLAQLSKKLTLNASKQDAPFYLPWICWKFGVEIQISAQKSRRDKRLLTPKSMLQLFHTLIRYSALNFVKIGVRSNRKCHFFQTQMQLNKYFLNVKDSAESELLTKNYIYSVPQKLGGQG